jgi:hypothetical protein
MGTFRKYRRKIMRVVKDAQAYSGANVAKKLITDPKNTAKNIKGAAVSLTLGPYDLIKGFAEGDERKALAKGIQRFNEGNRFAVKALHPGSSHAKKIERAEALAKSTDPNEADRGLKLLSRIDRVGQATASVVAGAFTGGTASVAISVALAARQEYLSRKKDKKVDQLDEADIAEIKNLEMELMQIKMGLKNDPRMNAEKTEMATLVDGVVPPPEVGFFDRLFDFFRQLIGKPSKYA